MRSNASNVEQYVLYLRSRLNSSESTAGSHRWSDSEFQTVGPATETRGSQKCCGELEELTVDDIWQIANAGDQELRTLAHSIWRDTMELGAEDNDGLSQQACTALAEE